MASITRTESQRLEFAPRERRGSYTLGIEVEKNVFLAERAADGAKFLAQPIPVSKAVRPTLALWAGQPGLMLKNLLNHENLVSMIDIIKVGNHAADPEYFLWDFCDAGTLENLLIEPEQFPNEHNTYFYPEAFVWHFVVSTLRALAYLHEGYRDFFDPSDGTRKTYKPDVDWFPILHRQITADNVFFCHPQGKETFGLCKLGEFSRAFVTAHVSGHAGEKIPAGRGTPVAPSTKYWQGLEQLHIFTRVPGGTHNTHPGIPDRLRPYTTGSDVAAVARLAFHLMRGKPTPPSGRCPECSCVHLSTFNNPRPPKYEFLCVHDCKYEQFDLANALQDGRDEGKATPEEKLLYSEDLLCLIEEMINLDGSGFFLTSLLYEKAYTGHRTWMRDSEEGNFVMDIEYEMTRRWGVAQKKYERV